MTLRAFRVGVVGARRVRDGTGAFLARFLHAAGCKVVAVAGTSEATAAEAARGLSAHDGIEAAPYGDARAMVERERLDALVVASPEGTHEPLLTLALDAGLHVLCEKPLLHAPDDDAYPARGAALVAAFAARGLCLVVDAQWRHALGAYMRLFPDVSPRAARRFSMRLSPSVGGRAAVPVAMPHPLSVLDHLAPPERPGLTDLEVDVGDPGRLLVRFTHPGRGVRAEVELVVTTERPRPFSFGFDGAVATRVVREPGYRAALVAEGLGREVALPDPVEAVVKDFVARVRRGPPFPPEPPTVPGLVHLREVDRAVAAALAAARR
ncbi:MAG: Gfo/Idh/MocA family oxidoreductase [Planctomycetes bacterium]|nr:Gfo/Idh/MocA family oxidoreductase [Planctomycetota bacterium]